MAAEEPGRKTSKPATQALARRLARAFVHGGKNGRVHSSFGIGLVAVALTVAFLVLTFGIYDSYADKLETIALSVYPHIVVIDRGPAGSAGDGVDELKAQEAAELSCADICDGTTSLDRRPRQGGAGGVAIERLQAVRTAVAERVPSATVAAMIFEEADLEFQLEEPEGALKPEMLRRLRVLGVDLDVQRSVPEVGRFVPAQLLEQLRRRPSALLLSEPLARSLGIPMATQSESFSIHVALHDGLQRFEITGTFELGFHSLSENLVIASLPVAQRLLGMPGGASYFGLSLEDPYQAREVRRGLGRHLFEANFSLSDWMGVAGGDFANIRLFRWILMVVLGMSLVITALGIRNTLTIVTVERRRQIGILRAIGLRDGPIRWVFLWIALGLGAIGSVFGLPLGTLGGIAFGSWLDHALADLLPIRGVEVALQPWAMVQVVVMVLVTSGLTALLSVRHALELEPVSCLAAE